MEKKKTVIGTYPLTNTGGVLVHEIDYYDDRVLASVNDDDPEWYDITEQYWEHTEQNETGFCIGELFVPFCEVIRTQILGGAV